MQHCHFKTLSLRQLTLYYIEMRKEVVLATFYSDGESIFKDVTLKRSSYKPFAQ